MNRIPFGRETRLEIIAVNCPGCSTPLGQFHEYGCVLETCPECSGRILNCKCRVLSLSDAFRITRAVADNITDRAEVTRAVDDGSKHLDETYYEQGIMIWIMRDVTERDSKGAGIMDQLMKEISIGKSGDFYKISPEEVAPLMGVTVDEASEALEALQAESFYPGWEKHTRDIQ